EVLGMTQLWGKATLRHCVVTREQRLAVISALSRYENTRVTGPEGFSPLCASRLPCPPLLCQREFPRRGSKFRFPESAIVPGVRCARAVIRAVGRSGQAPPCNRHRCQDA